MTERTILLVAEDVRRSRRLRGELRARGSGHRVRVLTDGLLADALGREQPAVAVVILDDEADVELVDRTLWAASRLRRSIPVVAVSRCYDPEQALLFLRMGVADYVSLDEHVGVLDRVLHRVAALSAQGNSPDLVNSSEDVPRAGSPWESADLATGARA